METEKTMSQIMGRLTLKGPIVEGRVNQVSRVGKDHNRCQGAPHKNKWIWHLLLLSLAIEAGVGLGVGWGGGTEQ